MTEAALRPRVLPSLAVLALVIPGFAVASELGMLVGLLVTGRELSKEGISEFMSTSPGLLYVLAWGQAFLLLAALVPTGLSRLPFRERLGLVRWRLPTRTMLFLVLATPAIQILASIPLLFLDLEDDPHFQLIEDLIMSPTGISLWIMILLTTAGAGVTEELLYRGYVQRRLQLRWRAALAILLPGVVFALMHGNWFHAMGVFPLGLWFGFVALRTGSVLPAIFCHVLNNAFAISLALMTGAEDAETATLPGTVLLAVLVLAFICLVAGIVDLRRQRHVPT